MPIVKQRRNFEAVQCRQNILVDVNSTWRTPIGRGWETFFDMLGMGGITHANNDKVFSN